MAVYIIGDIHGHLAKAVELLFLAKLIDNNQRWIGGDSRVWFMGDFFDRGPQGIGVVDLVMRLQGEAEQTGGQVRSLLGNHEVLFLGANRFQRNKKFGISWKRNGGQDLDMSLVTSKHLAWLRSLPALALVSKRLLMHADAMLYFEYGTSIDEVNGSVSGVLHSDDTEEWDLLLDDFSERMAFNAPRGEGVRNAMDYLGTFGGEQIIHGHTPIQYLIDGIKPKSPMIYASNLCVNVDGGIYLGGPGFAYKLPD